MIGLKTEPYSQHGLTFVMTLETTDVGRELSRGGMPHETDLTDLTDLTVRVKAYGSF